MFNNLRELISSMPDEKTCRDYLVHSRWNGKPLCPYCGFDRVYSIEKGQRFKCANSACYKRFSAITGTVFECSKIPVSKWLTAVYISTAHKKGISSYQLGRDIGVSQKTAWFMLHRIREGMRPKSVIRLNAQVQIDESYMGGRETNMHADKKSKTSQIANRRKTPVYGLLETGGNIVVQTTDWVNQTTAKELMDKHIETDAVIVTDSFPMYRKISREFKQHVSINHVEGHFLNNGYHINGVENFWSLFKRSIFGIYHSVSKFHLQRYCDEMAYRFNSRKMKDKDRFALCLQNCAGRLTYKQLIAQSLTLPSNGKDIETIQTDED
jgi:hypothetical protein